MVFDGGTACSSSAFSVSGSAGALAGVCPCYGDRAWGKTNVEVSLMEQKGKETVTKIRCPFCGVEFSTEEELEIHKKDAHPEE